MSAVIHEPTLAERLNELRGGAAPPKWRAPRPEAPAAAPASTGSAAAPGTTRRSRLGRFSAGEQIQDQDASVQVAHQDDGAVAGRAVGELDTPAAQQRTGNRFARFRGGIQANQPVLPAAAPFTTGQLAAMPPEERERVAPELLRYIQARGALDPDAPAQPPPDADSLLASVTEVDLPALPAQAWDDAYRPAGSVFSEEDWAAVEGQYPTCLVLESFAGERDGQRMRSLGVLPRRDAIAAGMFWPKSDGDSSSPGGGASQAVPRRARFMTLEELQASPYIASGSRIHALMNPLQSGEIDAYVLFADLEQEPEVLRDAPVAKAPAKQPAKDAPPPAPRARMRAGSF